MGKITRRNFLKTAGAAGVVAILLLCAAANAQMRPRWPEVGQAAPALHLAQVIGGPAPADVNWRALRGDVVVIEFWATWCPPCVESIPHLDALEREFAGRPVRFLSISYERPEVVKRFLAAHPISGWVGIDEKRETLNAYGVRFLPLTVVVDRHGRVAALTAPMALSEVALGEFLAGERPTLARPLGTARPLVAGAEPEETVARAEPLFYFDLRPDTSPVGAGTVDRAAGKVTIVGWPAKRLLALALDVPEDRIVGADRLPQGRFTLVADLPAEGADAWMTEMAGELGLAWGVRLRRERRKMDVYLLTAQRGTAREAGNRAISSFGADGGSRGITTAVLARAIERRLGRPVVDETHFDPSRRIRVKLTTESVAGVVREVEKAGFGLKQARRRVTVVTVERRRGGTGAGF